MKEKIENMLLDLGITPNLKGFQYLSRAIELVVFDKAKNICIDIYECIAKETKSTKACVERCIRHAISKIDIETNNLKCGLKNSEVIYTLALKIKQQEAEQNEQN
jgi:two-component system response regulator (stage 0 sporulation protein A)